MLLSVSKRTLYAIRCENINMHRGVNVQCHLCSGEWSLDILGQLNMCIDLVAADAMYCLSKFHRRMQESTTWYYSIPKSIVRWNATSLRLIVKWIFYTLELMWICGVEISSDTNSCEIGGSNEPSWLVSTKSFTMPFAGTLLWWPCLCLHSPC